MNNRVILLHRETPEAVVSNLTKLVGFMGGTVQAVALRGEAGAQVEILQGLIPRGGCVVADFRVLSPETRSMLVSLGAHVLVYGFDGSAASAELIKALTGGGIRPLDARQDAQVSVAECREVCGPMAGQTFGVNGTKVPFAFTAGNITPLISIGRDAFFGRVSDPGSRWMLLAGDGVADVDVPVPKGDSVLNHFPGLAPVMMFLRSAAPDAFWQNDAPTACFIVDDPLLKPRYGFLSFAKLFALMDERRFSTSIAFIPWNYRRSEQAVVAQFARRTGACSLSVHGCDHTRGEFAADDVPALAGKAQLALDRMERHRRLTGLGFDDVMVFPQGLFSRAAMPALQSCGYLAAVNSTPYPIDGEQCLGLRDLLGIAVTRFSGFPLFTRRYPGHIAALAFDLFLGKPAFVVEHHGYFQRGYQALAETVDKLDRLEARLMWTSLADACSRACLKRIDDRGTVHVQFTTDRLVLENRSDRQRTYSLTRQGGWVRGASAVLADGRELEVEAGADGLGIRLTLAPGQSARVKVRQDPPEWSAATPRTDFFYPLKVYLRRNLSEFRDNYIETSRLFRRQREAVK